MMELGAVPRAVADRAYPNRGSGWVVAFLLAGVSGCAATVAGAGVDASPADNATTVDATADAAMPTDLSTPDGPAADRPPVRCLPPADGPLRTPPSGPEAVIDVAEDTTYACILRGDGRIRCRGLTYFGEFADGTNDTTYRTVMLPIEGVRAFAMSLGFGCAVVGDGSVWCWGDNTRGRVHPDLPRRMLTPTRIAGLNGARRVSISLTWSRTCVLLDGGRVVCWVGGPDAVAEVAVERGATDVAAGISHTCVRFDDASARCTGPSANGATEFVIDAGGAEVVAAGTFIACAIDRAGAVTCWGARHPSTDVMHGPFDDGVRCATSIVLGFWHLCAATTDGAVTCWGGNSYGQLGSPRTDASPMRVPGVDRVVRVLRGMISTCALRDDGSLWCWGDGYLSRRRFSSESTLPHPIDW